MSGLDDILKGFSAFQEGVQQFATSRAIDSAQQQVESLNNSQLDEMAKRQQLSQVGNSLALDLAKFNAPASKVQTALSAIQPTAFKDSQDMYLQGLQKNDQKLTALGQQGMKAENQPKLDVVAAQGANELAKQRLANQGELDRSRMLALGKEKKPMTANEISEISAHDQDIMLGESLLKQVENDKNLVGMKNVIPGRGMIDDNYAAFKSQNQAWFDVYRKLVTGAGASPGELKMLAQSRPSETDQPDQYMAKTKRIVEIAKNIRGRKLQNLQKAGRNVDGFLSAADEAVTNGSSGQQQQQQSSSGDSQLPPGHTIKSVRNKSTGMYESLIIDPQGKPVGRAR